MTDLKVSISGNNRRIKVVQSMRAFFEESFWPANVILHARALVGDFKALASWLDREFQIEKKQQMQTLSPESLSRLTDRMGGGERFAALQIIDDMKAIRQSRQGEEGHFGPVLRILSSAGYESVNDYYTATFHHDRHMPAGQKTGRILCCYTGPVTEWINNEDARVRFSGDMLYDPLPEAEIHSFRLGEIWRAAGANFTAGQVDPFIHRSRKQKPGDLPRLVLQAE
jgi:hypothetical protein